MTRELQFSHLKVFNNELIEKKILIEIKFVDLKDVYIKWNMRWKRSDTRALVWEYLQTMA
jgi:hypothetical protein